MFRVLEERKPDDHLSFIAFFCEISLEKYHRHEKKEEEEGKETYLCG